MSTAVLDIVVRGNVKAAMRAAGANSADLWMVPVEALRIAPGFNVRDRTPEYIDNVPVIAHAQGTSAEDLTVKLVTENNAEVSL